MLLKTNGVKAAKEREKIVAKRRKGRPASPPDPGRLPEQRAIGLVQDARAYWTAAQIIEEADHSGVERGSVRLLTPGYFLISHAMELTLKAFLLSQGFDPDGLPVIGHDLNNAMQEAEARGFDVDDERFYDVVAILARYHRDHWFRYRAVGAFKVPVLIEAIDATASALDYVELIVRQNSITI